MRKKRISFIETIRQPHIVETNRIISSYSALGDAAQREIESYILGVNKK